MYALFICCLLHPIISWYTILIKDKSSFYKSIHPYYAWQLLVSVVRIGSSKCHVNKQIYTRMCSRNMQASSSKCHKNRQICIRKCHINMQSRNCQVSQEWAAMSHQVSLDVAGIYRGHKNVQTVPSVIRISRYILTSVEKKSTTSVDKCHRKRLSL